MSRGITTSGQKVFDARYAARDEDRNIIENFEQAVWRLAGAAALAEKEELREKWERTFAEVIGNLFLVPSTPIWANVGKSDRPWQPGACFVLDVEDSLEGMYETLKRTALVFKSGGGIGYNFSRIRPRGDLVRSTKGQASGVVELIRLYDSSSNMVIQGGTRRGASIGILNVDHPEIREFIVCKLHGDITNFNLSVGVTDRFMEALAKDQDWDLTFNGRVYATVPARELWNLICESAHSCGDPGMVFLDRLQDTNPVPSIFVDAVNPCGEIVLAPGESCLLSSINLARMVKDEGIDWDLLKRVVAVGVRFLDNLIDVAQYPLDQITENTRRTRKLGLGYTGLTDALILCGVAYDSPEGRDLAGKIASFVQRAAHDASTLLGEEKGNFPAWDQSVYYPHTPHRNAALTGLAPTGSVTMMAGCEGYGIEPLFAVAYRKETVAVGTLDVFSPLFLEACRKFDVPDSVLREVGERGSCQGVEGVPPAIQRVFKGAQEIDPVDHLLMQAELQKYVDNAIAKTCNLPNAATVEDVGTIFRLAHELKIKGITIFRDGCKKGTVNVGAGAPANVQARKLGRGEILPRPVSAGGETHRLDTGCGKIYLTVNYRPDTGEILETFITTGSDGGCQVYTEATSRLISLAIRGGIAVEEVIGQLADTHSCPSYQLARGRGKNVSEGRSCASAIAKKLQEIKDRLNGASTRDAGAKDQVLSDASETGMDCEMCGHRMDRAEGCYVCRECGYSRC